MWPLAGGLADTSGSSKLPREENRHHRFKSLDCQGVLDGPNRGPE